MAQNTANTQLEQANETLKQLSANVTSIDRKLAMEDKDLGYSYFTIWSYLKGEGKNLDTAYKLIKFFRKLIDERAKHISVPQN